jgi:hypothetical protein
MHNFPGMHQERKSEKGKIEKKLPPFYIFEKEKISKLLFPVKRENYF